MFFFIPMIIIIAESKEKEQDESKRKAKERLHIVEGLLKAVDILDEIINSNYELTKKLVSANSYRFFARNIKDLVKDSFIRKVRAKIKVNEYIMNIVSDYVASGFAKVLKDWFEDPGELSSKDFVNL